MDVLIDAVDRPEPIPMSAEIVGAAAGLPIVEYLHANTASWSEAPTVLGFSGGGMSGAMFALLAEHLAAQNIRLVAFDMPGHTPLGLLGPDTPPRSLITRANGAVRRAVSRALTRRWLPRSTRLEVLSHSAGIADVAGLIGECGDVIDRFVICGASLPGIGAMVRATRASAAAQSLDQVSLTTLMRTRRLPAGNATLMYGPARARVISDAALSRYECPEHFGVPLTMLRARPVIGQNWRGRRVLMIGSAGDTVVPPGRIELSARRLRARGAALHAVILSANLPHAFLSFAAGAQQVSTLVAAPDVAPSPLWHEVV
jgi:alpha-beta hydrolase superfamily lysophospholipase